MQPKTFHASDHDIDPALIDADALEVISRLREAGFLAYLVGGSVRDLLRKTRPKDYDISTSATPEDVKRVFRRNCILIGRRFRLAHIRFGHKILEVSTFRAGDTGDSDLIVRDNRWGTPEEDATRRDFTINGLFYDASNHQIIDYVGGWDDIHKHTLRTIGEPEARFKQDPVRMIRAIKFRARFDFHFDNATETALRKCKKEIVKSAPARVLEELFRMLESGKSEPFFRLMTDYELMQVLVPTMSHFLAGPHGREIYQYLAAADHMNTKYDRPPLDRGVLMCSLLYPILEKEIHKQYTSRNLVPHIGDITLLATALIEAVISSSFSHFPRRITSIMTSVLATQYRFTPLGGKRHFRPHMFRDKDFIFALQFLKMRSLVDPTLVEAYTHWKQLYRTHHTPARRKPHPGPHDHHHEYRSEGTHHHHRDHHHEHTEDHEGAFDGHPNDGEE